MALADYFKRNLVAASQLIQGFNEEVFAQTLKETNVAIAFGANAATTTEERHALDLAIRLLARLYPVISFATTGEGVAVATELEQLAHVINPNIDVAKPETATHVLCIGQGAPAVNDGAPIVYIGSESWDAKLSETQAQPTGSSTNPFGAGAAAALGCAQIFRRLFGGDGTLFRSEFTFSTFDGTREGTIGTHDPAIDLDGDMVLVGLGAVGNAAAWALSRAGLSGCIHLVDMQTIELSNIQRYVLTERDDENREKADHVAEFFLDGKLTPAPFRGDWAKFVETKGYRWPQVLVALDSAKHRRAVQATLPRRIVNAWTQARDLGVSEHGDFGGDGACLSCLYLPTGGTPNEDMLVAQALRVPERLMDIRRLLHFGDPVDDVLLALIGERLQIDSEALNRFRGSPIRRLYVEGICGGALVRLESASIDPGEYQVPMAHQSALAGILLASAAIRQRRQPHADRTQITRLDVMREVGQYLTQPARSAEDSSCTCRDQDYVVAFRTKYGSSKT